MVLLCIASNGDKFLKPLWVHCSLPCFRAGLVRAAVAAASIAGHPAVAAAAFAYSDCFVRIRDSNAGSAGG